MPAPGEPSYGQTIMKIEGSPEVEVLLPSPPVKPPSAMSSSTYSTSSAQINYKDPENFLRRCSAFNKKKGVRCSANIGKNAFHLGQTHPTYLPTCHMHQGQLSFVGFCQFKQGGERCSRIFRWEPPLLELCSEHQGHPDTPCYLFKLPLELRLEIFRYLLPTGPIGSSTALVHAGADDEPREFHGAYTVQSRRRPWNHNATPYERTTAASIFKVPLLDLLLISRQIYQEVKDMLYSSVPFVIDVRKDGTFMCGRRLLEPKRADGSSHSHAQAIDNLKVEFLKRFNWAGVKNYDINILVENGKVGDRPCYSWDEEVEIYDIRDYIGVVVSGILSKSRNLCRLNVRLGLHKFQWNEEDLLMNAQTLLGPFERLRNVRQPRLVGIYTDTTDMRFPPIMTLPLPTSDSWKSRMAANTSQPPLTPICSIPPLPTDKPYYFTNTTQARFLKYRLDWQDRMSSPSSTSLLPKPPICEMFTKFKEFYTHLETILPELVNQQGKRAFLHRARVAREHENVEEFRLIRNELIECWSGYLEIVEKRRDDVNMKMGKLLDADVYPSAQDDSMDPPSSSLGPDSSADSPVMLDMQAMRNNGTLLQGNAENLEQTVWSMRQIVARHQQFLQQQAQWQQQVEGQRDMQDTSSHSSTGRHQQASESPTTQQADNPQAPRPAFIQSNVPLEEGHSSHSSTSPSSSPTTTFSPSTAQSSTTWTPPMNPIRLGSGAYDSSSFIDPAPFSDHDTFTRKGESSKSVGQPFSSAHFNSLSSAAAPTDTTMSGVDMRPGTAAGNPILIPEDEDEYVDIFKEWAPGKGKVARRGDENVAMGDVGIAPQSWKKQDVEYSGQVDHKGKGKERAVDGQMMWD